ncbi:hypothetical protein M9434_005788 [Picochlorum sp. BPE23]|nr:hypothetical protein M9434_005788 [Picochlorum sp. BPE23]
MGKRGGKKGGGGRRGKRARENSANWTTKEDFGNDEFEEYYKVQKVCPDDQWDAFMTSLKSHLPMTFRINGSGRFANDLRRKLEEDFMSRFSNGPLEIDGEVIEPPKPLPWYPDKLAWQMNFSRYHLRRIDALKDVHEFMKRETDTGAITRQEAVSMIPPLFLDVQPHHRVLDMCAAPGSKTFQLLEALHQGGQEPTGVVVANDSDMMRCNMLTHQSQRMKSPSIVVTNHEAQIFPSVQDSDPNSTDKNVMYDRILCDVPCSGDGTVRKQPDIWKKWSVANGNGLHILQLRIALRGAELLKVGGRMVYSTCTFNPIEDEAVVAELLRRTHGALELVDMSHMTKELKFEKGMVNWGVRDRDGWYKTFADAENAPKIEDTMFPKGDEEELNLPFAMRFLPHHQDTGGFFVAVLQKTKVMPPVAYPARRRRSWAPKRRIKVSLAVRDSDCGSCVSMTLGLYGSDKKVEKDTTEKPEVKSEKHADTDITADVKKTSLPPWGVRGGGTRNADSSNNNNNNRRGWKGVDPMVPFFEEEHLTSMKAFYGIPDDCPVLSSLISRTFETKPKKLAYISPGVKLLLQMDAKESLKVVFCGLKIFERHEGRDGMINCIYRICQEGLHSILPYMTKQILYPSIEEFIGLLRDKTVDLPESYKTESPGDDDSKPQTEPMQTGERKAPRRIQFSSKQALEDISKVQMGSCVALLQDDYLKELGLQESTQGGLRAHAPFAIPCWRGRSGINAMVSRLDCDQMLDRLESAKPGIVSSIIIAPNE